MDEDGHREAFGFGVDSHGAGVGGVEILDCGGDGDAAELEVVFGDADFFEGGRFSGVDAGEADEFLRKSCDVVGDEAIGDFGSEVAAFEAENDGTVDGGALGPVMVGIGGGDGSPGRAAGRDAGGSLAIGQRDVAQVQLAQLLGRLPDMRVTIYDHTAR